MGRPDGVPAAHPGCNHRFRARVPTDCVRGDGAPGRPSSSGAVVVRRRAPLQGETAAVLAVLTLAATACTGASDAPAPPELVPLPDAPAEACTAVLEHGLAIEARTRAALREELGEPDSVAREAVPNRHVPGATDTVVTMRWPAATAVVRVAQSRELVDAIRVTDVRHLRHAGVGPGTPRDSILARLGEAGRRVGGGDPVPIGRPGPDASGEAPPRGAPDPSGPGAETLSYWCPSEPGAESPVLFHVRDGRVAAVEWDFYVD